MNKAFSLRRIRLRLVWLLVVPFFWFATPTPKLLAAGALLAVIGLGIRAWSAGSIRKDQELATGGPYAFSRNPLYLGSLLLGMGAVTAGGRWVFVVLFLAFFVTVYGTSMKHEARQLEERFGDRFRAYAAEVPLFFPRLTGRGSEAGGEGFSARQYKRNREYEALLGAAAAFALLTAKYYWLG